MKRISYLLAILWTLWYPCMLIHADGNGSQTPARVQIIAHRFTFQPATITLRRGQPVVLVLQAADAAHGLRIRELGIDIKAQKGHSSEVALTPQTVGDFIGHCSVFCGVGHGGMSVTVHVEP